MPYGMNAFITSSTDEVHNDFNPMRTGGVFHQAQGFLPITLEVIKVHSPNLLTFPKF